MQSCREIRKNRKGPSAKQRWRSHSAARGTYSMTCCPIGAPSSTGSFRKGPRTLVVLSSSSPASDNGRRASQLALRHDSSDGCALIIRPMHGGNEPGMAEWSCSSSVTLVGVERARCKSFPWCSAEPLARLTAVGRPEAQRRVAAYITFGEDLLRWQTRIGHRKGPRERERERETRPLNGRGRIGRSSGDPS